MPKVKYKNDNEEAEIKAGGELGEFAQKQGWNIPLACEDGVCGTCLVKITKGMKNLSPLEETEKTTLTAMGALDGKHRLACQCKVMGDVEVETE